MEGKNVFLIVEGDAEEAFYKNVLSEHFKEKLTFTVTKMPSKRSHLKKDEKRGRVSFESFSDVIQRFIRSTKNYEKLIFIYDYYGLDKTFKDHFDGSEITLDLKIRSIKQRLEKEANNRKFSVYLQVHEFESFLFSDPEIIVNHFDDP